MTACDIKRLSQGMMPDTAPQLRLRLHSKTTLQQRPDEGALMTTTLITARTVRSMQPTMYLIGSKMVMKRRARRQKSMRTMRSRYGCQWVSTAKSMTSSSRSTRFRGSCAKSQQEFNLVPT
jgi:hypothetical protein